MLGRKAHKALCSACCVTSGSCPTSLNFQTLEAGMTLPVLWQAAGGGPASTQTLSGTQLSSPALATKKPTVPDSTAHLGHSGCQYIQQNTGISHPPAGHCCTSHVHSCKLRETQEQVEPQPHQGTYGDIASCPIVYLECRNNLGNPEPWYRITGKGGSPERAG